MSKVVSTYLYVVSNIMCRQEGKVCRSESILSGHVRKWKSFVNNPPQGNTIGLSTTQLPEWSRRRAYSATRVIILSEH